MSLGGEAASHPILEMIYKILEVVIIIAVTIAICYIVYRLIVNFYHDFRAADMENKDKRRYILPEERGRTRIEQEGRLSPLDFSPDARIRRIYIRLIRRHPEAEKIRPFHTPAEIEEAVLGGRKVWESAQEPLARVHACYELARYAPERVTAEDVRIMREAAREVR